MKAKIGLKVSVRKLRKNIEICPQGSSRLAEM